MYCSCPFCGCHNEGQPLANHPEGPYDGIGDSNSWMKIAFFSCKIRFRTYMFIIWGQNKQKRITKSEP